MADSISSKDDRLVSWYVPVAFGNAEITQYPLNCSADGSPPGMRVYMASQADAKIEQLTRELATTQSQLRGMTAYHQDAYQTCDRLRAAIQDVLDGKPVHWPDRLREALKDCAPETRATEWKVSVRENDDGVWLAVIGPEGQGAAFNVQRDSIRANVLRQFRDAQAKNATPGGTTALTGNQASESSGSCPSESLNAGAPPHAEWCNLLKLSGCRPGTVCNCGAVKAEGDSP